MDVLPHEKPIAEYEKTILQFRKQNGENPLLSKEELKRLEKKLDKLKERVYSTLTPWERVQICRHPSRPRSLDYIKNISENFFELFGDRTFSDDSAIVGGLAEIGGVKCVIVGQEKGCDTTSRLHRNFGMVHPEGFRKALRLAQLGEKFGLPVVFLVDTPGAYCGLSAEERGQGWAIAMNLRELFRIETPLIVVVIGEGCSGGALGIGIGDTIAMLEHAYYSVISPESCASILWKDPSKKEQAAEILKMHAEDLMRFDIVDTILKEPLGGAHHDPKMMYEGVKNFIIDKVKRLEALSTQELLNQRYCKFRKMGCFSRDETTTPSRTT